LTDADNIPLRPKYAGYDALAHDHLARSIIEHVEALPLGTVVAVQGSWGSGKTDVVARIFDGAKARTPAWPSPLWLNPWKYGTPDLITPLVLEILRRVPVERRRGNQLLRDAAKTLLRAGNAMLFKTVSVVAPFGSVLGAGEHAVDDFLKELFTDEKGERGPDVDPLAAMAERFRELVAEYVRVVGQGGRLIICVDDLDRCLPDHQIAMLEAIHFLTSARAACSFVIALDPALVRQAAETHYRTAGFDSSRYLDKLFDLRIYLPALGPERIAPLVRRYGEAGEEDGGVGLPAEKIAAVLGVDVEQLVEQFGATFYLPELANPRLILRVLMRLMLLARALGEAEDERLTGENWLRPVLIWSAITERWPQVRETLQSSHKDGWSGNTELMCWHYGISEVAANKEERDTFADGLQIHANVIARLPTREQAPDLGDFLYTYVVQAGNDIPAALHHCDQIFGQYGV
jgi:KAP family P-loop domain